MDALDCHRSTGRHFRTGNSSSGESSTRVNGITVRRFRCFRGSRKRYGHSKVERLDIYAEAYFTRLVEALRSDYGLTARYLGDLAFRKMVADYLKFFPSRNPNSNRNRPKIDRVLRRTYPEAEDARIFDRAHRTRVGFDRIVLRSTERDSLLPERLANFTDEDWERDSLSPRAFGTNHRLPLGFGLTCTGARNLSYRSGHAGAEIYRPPRVPDPSRKWKSVGRKFNAGAEDDPWAAQ